MPDQLDLMELRFARVVLGVSSSPFLLNATIRHHLERYEADQPDLIKKLLKSLYVDDLATGAEDEEQAFQMFTMSKEILASTLDSFILLQRHCRPESILMWTLRWMKT